MTEEQFRKKWPNWELTKNDRFYVATKGRISYHRSTLEMLDLSLTHDQTLQDF